MKNKTSLIIKIKGNSLQISGYINYIFLLVQICSMIDRSVKQTSAHPLPHVFLHPPKQKQLSLTPSMHS